MRMVPVWEFDWRGTKIFGMPHARYHSLSRYLRQRYGCRVHKVTLHAGFTCPNRDGTLGSDAVPDTFNDSEMAGGLTNHRGLGVRLSYGMRDWWMLRATLLNADWLDPDINQELQRGGSAQSRSVLVDTVFRF